VLQIGLDLLPVKASIEAAYLVQGVTVLRHGTMMQYRRFRVKTDARFSAEVIYVPDPEPDSAFVVTAYDLGPKAKQALGRRRGKKGS
jgi:hypothetical protein